MLIILYIFRDTQALAISSTEATLPSIPPKFFPFCFTSAANPIHLVGGGGPESAEGHIQHGLGRSRKHSTEDGTAEAGPNRTR